MMRAYVVDTNVAVVANGNSPQADVKCRLVCTEKLRTFRENENIRVCIDAGDLILAEYRSQLSMSGQPGVGDMFMKWIHNNQCNPSVCERVGIIAHAERGFEEFPMDPRLASFDRGDRKFVAVALASTYKPDIVNAVDSDWLEYREPLTQNKVKVIELCLNCIKKCRNQ